MADCVRNDSDPGNPFTSCGSCITFHAVSYRAPAPSRVENDPAIGWNSGARSVTSKSGNCYVEFDMPQVTGVVCGLARSFISTSPVDVSHGFFFESSAGQTLYSVVENGVQVSAPTAHSPTTLFRIERVAGVVTYKVGGTTVHTSALPLYGAVVVVGLMYAAPDGIGRAA